MTITVAIKIGDGLVLASDSATTQNAVTPAGQVMTMNIWNSANKIFNLRKTWPLGAMTWGMASIDGRTIAEHVKDLRAILTGDVGHASVAKLDQDSYTIEQVAQATQEYFQQQLAGQPQNYLGLLIGGYSAGASKAEVFELTFDGTGQSNLLRQFGEAESGLLQWGQPEAISRIVDGLSEAVPQALANLGVPPHLVGQYAEAIKAEVALPIIHDGMPIAEAAELAEFLVDATIKFVRFTPGNLTVGGPVEVAVLTRHEGFKWVRRKHHFDPILNGR